MPNGVKCSVSNCTFWKEGNKCNADQIQVDLDQHASFYAEFASESFVDHQDEASESSVTCCQTFRKR